MPSCRYLNPGETLDFRHFLLVIVDTWKLMIGREQVSREKNKTKLNYHMDRLSTGRGRSFVTHGIKHNTHSAVTDKSFYGFKMQEETFIELNQLGDSEQRAITSDLMAMLHWELATTYSLHSCILF